MKRLTYISSFSHPMTDTEISKITEVSQRNNFRDGLTGALMVFQNMFYQILEGDDDNLDKCYERILRDGRHKDIFCLGIENDIPERNYANWSMKGINLDTTTDPLLAPMREMLRSLTATHKMLEAYVPKEVLAKIQVGLTPKTIPSVATEKIVLFSDIVGSTALTEILGPSVVRLLNAYYNAVVPAIVKAGGTISKLTGDGLMAYFPARQSGNVLLAIQESLDALKELRSRNFGPEKYLYAGFGLTAGPVIEGNIGTELRRDYTLIGDIVNTSARIESVSRRLGKAVLIDESVLPYIPKENLTAIGRFRVRGRETPVRLFTMDYPANDILGDAKVIADSLRADLK